MKYQIAIGLYQYIVIMNFQKYSNSFNTIKLNVQ